VLVLPTRNERVCSHVVSLKAVGHSAVQQLKRLRTRAVAHSIRHGSTRC
jgi:hypothetical protein